MTRAIDLFICDIDGCLADPYQAFDLAGLGTMASLVRRAENNGDAYPLVSLCSGRPYSYVEAMTQVLGIRQPVLFESGGGSFDPETTETIWSPAFTSEIEQSVRRIRDWMASEIAGKGRIKLDYDKRTQAGILSPHIEDIERVLPQVEKYVSEVAPEMNVFKTHVSIDVVAPGITKQDSLPWLAELTGVPVERMAYIGDTNGDLGALEDVGVSYAPANATPEVKGTVDHVMDEEIIHGTLKAYKHCCGLPQGEKASVR